MMLPYVWTGGKKKEKGGRESKSERV